MSFDVILFVYQASQQKVRKAKLAATKEKTKRAVEKEACKTRTRRTATGTKVPDTKTQGNTMEKKVPNTDTAARDIVPANDSVTPTEIKTSSPKQTDAKETLALDVLNGDACGMCKAELADSMECFECTASNCDRAFHRQCVLDICIDIYKPAELQSDSSEKWQPPANWRCPTSKSLCMMCKPISQISAYYRCQHCKADFCQQHWTAESEKICYYCNLVM